MKVAVTGGAGFIGSHVTDDLLRHGHEVVVIDDLSTGNAENLREAFAHGLVELIDADVASSAAQRALRAFKPEVILLLAAQSSVKVSMRDPLRDARDNVIGLVTVLEGAVEVGTRKVVLATSGGTIYGEIAGERLPIVESDHGMPNSFYGLTKRVGADYLRLYREHRGLDYVALALGNVYGERQDPNGEAGVVAIFLDRLQRGQPCIINGVGDTTRDFVHVCDVTSAFRYGMERGTGLINIGTARETSVNGVYAALARYFPGARQAEYGDGLVGEVKRVSLDWTRARERLGWAPTISFEQGIESLVRESKAKMKQ